jgi:hypothetical protein
MVKLKFWSTSTNEKAPDSENPPDEALIDKSKPKKKKTKGEHSPSSKAHNEYHCKQDFSAF